jgi:hypothetical protein
MNTPYGKNPPSCVTVEQGGKAYYFNCLWLSKQHFPAASAGRAGALKIVIDPVFMSTACKLYCNRVASGYL